MRKKLQIPFSVRVLRVVSQIKEGDTMSYSEVAARAGSSRACRAVGNILNRYDVRVWGKLPCHRVIRKDGNPGGYRWGRDKKAGILKKELHNFNR